MYPVVNSKGNTVMYSTFDGRDCRTANGYNYYWRGGNLESFGICLPDTSSVFNIDIALQTAYTTPRKWRLEAGLERLLCTLMYKFLQTETPEILDRYNSR